MPVGVTWQRLRVLYTSIPVHARVYLYIYKLFCPAKRLISFSLPVRFLRELKIPAVSALLVGSHSELVFNSALCFYVPPLNQS